VSGRCAACERDRDRARGPAKAAKRAGSAGAVAAVRRRDRRCVLCGHAGSPGNPLEVHHRVRIADGGGHEEANLVTLCRSCHAATHEWKSRQRASRA